MIHHKLIKFNQFNPYYQLSVYISLYINISNEKPISVLIMISDDW